MRSTTRNVGTVVAAFLVAYALFGYFTGNIAAIPSERGRGLQFAHGEQAVWVALGYVSYATAALIIAVGGFLKPSKLVYKDFSLATKEVRVPQLMISSSGMWAMVFIVIGVVLAVIGRPH